MLKRCDLLHKIVDRGLLPCFFCYFSNIVKDFQQSSLHTFNNLITFTHEFNQGIVIGS